MSAVPDLSGEWRGVFNYPAGHPSTEFTATLRDAGGVLSGEVSEPALFGADAGGVIHARIDGRRDGRAVAFTKFYEATDYYDLVAYRGEVSAEGDEIAGRWTIPDIWSGSFIMVRPRGAAAEAEQRAAEPVR